MANTDYFKRMFSSDIERIWRQNKGERSAVVYMFEDKESPNLYVGTTIDIKERLSNHIRSAENKKDGGRSWFYNVVRKYGWDRFEFFVLECDLTQKEGFVLEKKWIKTLNSYEDGYNMTEGGDGASSGESHIFARKIKGVNLDTGDEYHWGWIGGAAEHLGVGSNNIRKILDDDSINKQSYNFDKTERYVFKYEEDETPWDTSIVSFIKPIVVRNIDTKELLTFKSISEAGRYMNIDQHNISAVLLGKCKQFYSNDKKDRFEAQYAPPSREWRDDIIRWEDKVNKPINAYKNGEFLSWYKSAAEAGRVLNLNKNMITQTARHKQNGDESGVYTFEYADPVLREKQPQRNPKSYVFYIKNDEKIIFQSISDASRETIGKYSLYGRRKQITTSINTKNPDVQGIQWYKST